MKTLLLSAIAATALLGAAPAMAGSKCTLTYKVTNNSGWAVMVKAMRTEGWKQKRNRTWVTKAKRRKNISDWKLMSVRGSTATKTLEINRGSNESVRLTLFYKVVDSSFTGRNRDKPQWQVATTDRYSCNQSSAQPVEFNLVNPRR